MCQTVVGVCLLVAGRDLHVPHALLALHVAAPVELALASLRPTFSPRCVAAVATQQVAPVDAFRLRVAFPTLRPEASFLDVQLAVVRTGDQVDQVDVAVVLEPMILGHQHSAAASSFLFHLVSSIKLLLQHCANHSEAGEGPPACLELAGPAHSVALALNLHVPLQQLSASLIVVKVHQADWVFRSLSALPPVLCIHKSSREGDAKVNVVGTAGPLKPFWTHSSQ